MGQGGERSEMSNEQKTLLHNVAAHANGYQHTRTHTHKSNAALAKSTHSGRKRPERLKEILRWLRMPVQIETVQRRCAEDPPRTENMYYRCNTSGDESENVQRAG